MKCLTTTGYDDARIGCDIKDRGKRGRGLGVEKTKKQRKEAEKKIIKKQKQKHLTQVVIF